jgi:hypothetical protein
MSSIGTPGVRAGLLLELDVAGLYLSPLSRWCRWQPRPLQPGPDLHFVYDTPSGRAPRGNAPDGFSITPHNLRILRRVR